MDKSKNQYLLKKTSTVLTKEPIVTVTETKLSVENALRRIQPDVSVSDNIRKVIDREFYNIFKNINL